MRVDVGVGDRVRVTLAKPRARFPSLAGMMAKCEVASVFVGTITGGGYTGGFTPDGRREVKFTLREDDGVEHELLKSEVIAAERVPQESEER